MYTVQSTLTFHSSHHLLTLNFYFSILYILLSKSPPPLSLSPVLTYLLLFRLEEMGVACWKKLFNSQHAGKMHKVSMDTSIGALGSQGRQCCDWLHSVPDNLFHTAHVPLLDAFISPFPPVPPLHLPRGQFEGMDNL